MSPRFDAVFARLRAILEKHGATFVVSDDAAGFYRLQGSVGPATIRAWGGKAKIPVIPVAWVQVGRSAVAYHLMALDGNPRLQQTMSPGLKARMKGKTCLHFKATDDEALFLELDTVTARALEGFRKAGFVA